MNNLCFVIIGINEWEEFTLPFLSSIAKHEPTAKVVLVDNGSIPAYPEHPTVTKKVRSEKIIPFPSALNIGIQTALGFERIEWILPVNNDVIVEHPLNEDLLKASSLNGFCIRGISEHSFLSSWALVGSPELWKTVGNFDEHFAPMYYEDADYSLRAVAAGFPLNLIDRKLFGLAHLEKDRKTIKNSQLEAWTNNKQYLQKKHSLETTRMGIIPAAGKGSRWGGFAKELLPIGEKEWLLERTIKTLDCDANLIITSPEKISQHIMATQHLPYNIAFSLQKHEQDIWGAIKTSFPYSYEYNLFSMPDTIIPSVNAFPEVLTNPFYLGVFETKIPERFGVLLDRQVVNKVKLEQGTYRAWGTLIWSKEVVDYWKSVKIDNYTDAINLAIQKFGLETFPLRYYYDLANWEEYSNYVKEN